MEHRAAEVRGISLRERLADAEFIGADDIRLTSCCGDSRCCQAGDVFVAMQGEQHDGHDFVIDAERRGARALVAERAILGSELPTCIVPDSRQAYGRICQALAGDPSRQLKVVGVAGANGKTTTSYLIAAVLEAGGFYAGVMSSLGYYDGARVVPAERTTPGAPTLAQWLARMVGNGCTHAVLELSRDALEQHRAAGVAFDIASVTNLGSGSTDAGRSAGVAQRNFLEQLAPEAFTILNADDAQSVDYLHMLQGPVLTVGVHAAAELTATPVEHSISEQTFLLQSGAQTVPVRTSLIGLHNIHNCLTAAAVGMVHGLDLATIVRGLESIERIPGRLERLECGQSFGVFVDDAHTPHALEHSLRTLRQVTPGRLICVFGAAGEGDRLQRPALGGVAESLADVAIVTSDNPRGEDQHAITEDILLGFDDRQAAHVEHDRAEAIRFSLGEARRGDCVVIAGRGSESHQIVGQKRLPLDDRDIARDWLYEAVAPSEIFRTSA